MLDSEYAKKLFLITLSIMKKMKNKRMKKKAVVILYSKARRKDFLTDDLYDTEREVFERGKIIKSRLEKVGYDVFLVPGDIQAIRKITKISPYVVFNLVDSVYGKEDLCTISPAVLELLKVPYTGAGIDSLSLNADKNLTKLQASSFSIPVPEFQIMSSEKDKLKKTLTYPLIVKLNRFHGSIEISNQSVVENQKELERQVKYLIHKYNSPVIVEKYIKGKEITVLMIENGNDPIVLSEERIIFSKEKYKLFGYREAWSDKEYYDCRKIEISPVIKKDVIRAFKLLKMRDYGRFEIIIDSFGKHYFIDFNVNPAFGPVEAGEAFGYLLHIHKLSFEKVTDIIINNVRKRF